jgi:hypothetical protein
MYGLHFQDTLAGRVFSQTVTPLGLAIPIYTATAIGGAGICSLPIWNPPNSNRIVELVQLDLNYGSGTADYGSIVLMAVPLLAVATGALCTALATTTPINGLLGSGTASKVKSNNGAGTCTVTAGTAGAPSETAPGVWRSLADINLEAQTGTAHGVGIHKYTFDGTVSVGEGWMIYLACTKASVALYASGIVWKEVQLNPGT